MENNIKVSVIVPIYNVEEYLEECLDSLVKQTLKGIEVLMIDDGSTDHSASIAKRFDEKYDHFHYFYKENGGLGNARNYAIPYVKGEYLIFLDSDDVVPEDAYKKMYDMAVRTGNDMVIGNVKRFNSSKEWDSGLHKRLFDSTYEHTSIYQKPELVYDTTSWNKLFKTSFYLENNFQFPEKILYEDIPVTIPAHFKANSVSMIDDICYLWRVRDGVSKSITQNRTQIINLQDRIKIMQMVNKYYEENITDEKALYMKDFKWLDIDLKIYINEFLNVDDEYLDYAMDAIAKFLKTIDKKIFDEIRVIDKLKYHYILQGNRTRLLEVLEYEKKAFKSLTISKKGNHYIGNLPFTDINKEDFSFEKQLSNFNPVQVIEQLQWDNHKLNVSGYFYLPKLKSQCDLKADAYLENIHTGEKVPVDLIKKDSKDLTNKFGKKYCRKPIRIARYNYDHCRFNLILDIDELEKLKGVYKVKIHYYNEIIDNTFTLSNNRKTLIRGNYLKYINNKKVFTHFVAGNDLEIFFEDYLEISVNETCDTQLKMNMSDEKIYISNENSNVQEINPSNIFLTQLNNGSNYFYSNRDNEIVYLSLTSQSEYIFKNKELWILDNDSKGAFYIAKYNDTAFVKKMYQQENKLFIHMEVPNVHNKLPKIIFKNEKYNYLVECDLILESTHEDFSTYILELDFENNESVVKNLASGDYKLYIEFDALHTFEIKAFKNQYYSFVNGQYKYLLYIDDASNLTMSSEYTWIKSENTVSKRRLIKKYIYPLFMKRKLQNNVIVFESFWGKQYSCNPKYLYEYIQENYPNMKCVWFLNDERIMVNGNAERVRQGSLQYYKYLATAKYFVNNVNFSAAYKKRTHQIEIQTMHGTPLKTLGLDVKEDFPDDKTRDTFLMKCHRWNHLIVQSDWTAEYTKSCYDFKKDYLRTGYPRNDILFEKNNDEDIACLKEKLGLPVEKKVILYAPTWRRKNYFDMQLDITDMQNKLGDDYILVLRLHHFSVKGLKKEMLNDFVYDFSSYPTIQDLYLISDILITDYSSVMFDYSILKRPMLFFTYDLEDYRDNMRGFNFDFEKVAPGPLLMNSEEVIEHILNIDIISKEYEKKYSAFVQQFTSYENGTASKQITDKLFNK